MTIQIEHYRQAFELTLIDRLNSPIPLHTDTLSLTRYNEDLIECRVVFDVSSKLYKEIDSKAIFNLKTYFCNPVFGEAFLPNFNFKIEVILKPNLLNFIPSKVISIDEFSNYISQLGKLQPNHPLLLTENWLCLSVKQPTAPGEPGYRTFWADISPAAILEAGISSEEISGRIVNFFQTWAETGLDNNSQKNPLTMLEEMVDVLQKLADFGDGLAKSTTRTSEDDLQPPVTKEKILEVAIRFFTEDDWSFTKIQGQSALQIGCQGKNGEWNCYAKVREDEQQFVFYSLCPLSVPAEKRSAIAHFLTLANYGMMIGNFELDFTDGEIRYKTSIDVEGDRLSSALIKRLVYPNVTMMDEYLPGIKSVIENDVEPKDAIAKIEGQPE